jgi:hypothetical protein
VFGREEVINGWPRLKLSHNSSQSRPVVMDLRFFHATLSAFITEEVEHIVEGLFRIIQHVRERPTLTVLKKILTGDGCSTHVWAPL